jgi:Flp pilus assembly protein TadG
MTLRGHFSATSAPQAGATMVEFAIVAVVFFSLLLGIMDFGRLLFTWNAAAEATRWGARIAVVCNKVELGEVADKVRTRMKRILPQLTDGNIVITYYNPVGTVDNSCTMDTCQAVEVSLSGFTFDPISPFMPFALATVPDFRTYLLRESMEAVNAAGDQNPVCFI